MSGPLTKAGSDAHCRALLERALAEQRCEARFEPLLAGCLTASGLCRGDILGVRRAKHLLPWRAGLALILRREGMGFPRIGAHMRRHHTAIMHYEKSGIWERPETEAAAAAILAALVPAGTAVPRTAAEASAYDQGRVDALRDIQARLAQEGITDGAAVARTIAARRQEIIGGMR